METITIVVCDDEKIWGSPAPDAVHQIIVVISAKGSDGYGIWQEELACMSAWR